MFSFSALRIPQPARIPSTLPLVLQYLQALNVLGVGGFLHLKLRLSDEAKKILRGTGDGRIRTVPANMALGEEYLDALPESAKKAFRPDSDGCDRTIDVRMALENLFGVGCLN